MSGSGGGGGYTPSPPTDDNCLTLIIRTTLNSPKAAIVSTIKKDDILDVIAKSETGPVVVLKDGKEAGSITDHRILSLIKCINDGHIYIAKVTGISGGTINVEIRIKS